MARATAPLLSLAASGTFADLITASSLNGRHTLRKKPIARQTWTKQQRSHYVQMSFLMAAWRVLPSHTPAGLQQLWQPIADELGLPLYQAFLKTNLARWQANLQPIIAPASGGTSTATATMSFPIAGKGTFGFFISGGANNNIFGNAVQFRTTFSTSWNIKDLALIIPSTGLNQNTGLRHIDHITPGTYNFYSYQLHTNGNPPLFRNSLLSRVIT